MKKESTISRRKFSLVKLPGLLLGSIVCMVVFCIVGAITGILYPFYESKKDDGHE